MATLFRGGTVVTNLPQLPTTDAVAVHEGRVVALGPEALDWATAWDDVVDLSGRCLVPGFRDGHAHPLAGGIEMASLQLAGLTTAEAVIAAVADWAAAHPADQWIVGAGYSPAVLPDGVGDARWLDAVAGERPIALTANDHHTMWVNSSALTAAGIDASTPDPDGGEIVRRSDGTPIGTLREFGALSLMQAVMPRADAATRAGGLPACLGELARHGIVWVQDALVTADLLDTYVTAASDGPLSCRFNLAFRAQPGSWRTQVDEFVGQRALLSAVDGAGRSLTARTVKFFADGVIEAGTGFLLEPYVDAPHTCGLPNWAPDELADAVRAFDAAGFQIHIHAIGDGGVRMALDAIEHAQRYNGAADRRPVIAHTQLVHVDDVSRFASLGVIANFEPIWSQLDPIMVELTIPRLGPERSRLQYQIGTLAGSGARISFGSDWPVSSLNPIEGLAVAVTRTTNAGTPAGGWLPEERVPLLQAISAYTAGTAYQAFDEHDRGTLARGAWADLAVLAADITTLDGDEARDITVDHTMLAGATVHRAA
jgi:predicted amidohydrolase YtcJ